MKKLLSVVFVLAMCLTFQSEENANTALEVVNSSYGVVKPGYNAATGQNEGKGQTTTWANVQKAYEQDMWYFSKPANEHMTGVENYEEKEFSQDWVPPVEDI